MIDTVKLLIPLEKPELLNGSKFSPVTPIELMTSSNYGKTSLNPSKAYAKMGRYMPRLTLFKRPTKHGPIYQLAIEFSAPKMLFNNNFDELTESDFRQLVRSIIDKVTELSGKELSYSQIVNADVGAWHSSKNIIFFNYIASQTVLSAISKLEVSKVYDFQKDRYRDGGHVLHIHCNSKDIAFYDKMADLRKAKISPKRSFEKDSLVQMSLLDKLEQFSPVEVLRYEVRLIGKASVKRAFQNVANPTFINLYNLSLNKELLITHWKAVTKHVDMLSLDVHKPYELLLNVIEDLDDITPNTSLATVAGLLLIKQVGVSDFRAAIEKRFGIKAWQRINTKLIVPSANSYSFFKHIDEALNAFTPTKISSLPT